MAEENEPIYVHGDEDNDSLAWYVALGVLYDAIPFDTTL